VAGVRKGKVEIEPSIPKRDDFSSSIAKSQNPIFAQDALASGIKPTFLENKQIKSFASIPLVVRGTTVGVLHLNFLEPHFFSLEEQEIIGMLASQAAVRLRMPPWLPA